MKHQLYMPNKTQTYMGNIESPDGLVLLGFRGSISHGMADLDTVKDFDLMGVVIPDYKHYLGLGGYRNATVNEALYDLSAPWNIKGTKLYQEGKWDVVYYEIQKFFQMLLAANPNVLYFLWNKLDMFPVIHPVIEKLLEKRHYFLSRRIAVTFTHYAQDQIDKMETRDPAELRDYMAVTAELKARGQHPQHKGEYFDKKNEAMAGEEINAANTSTDKLLAKLRKYQKKGENLGRLGEKRKQLVLEHGFDTKNAAHCIRLLRMCLECLRYGDFFPDRSGIDASELLDIVKGKWPIEVVKERAKELKALCNDALKTSPLYEEPYFSSAEVLLTNTLKSYLFGIK